MKKLATYALAGLMVCAGPGAWAGTLACPVTGSLDSQPAGKAHDADFLFINENGVWDNFPTQPKVYDNVFSDDDTSIADAAAILSGGNAQQQAFFETAVIPSMIWLGLLEEAVTNPSFPNHAAACAAFSDNLDAATAWNAEIASAGYGVLVTAFESGPELIAGVISLNPQIWAPIIYEFVNGAIQDAFGPSAMAPPLDPNDFTPITGLSWHEAWGSNTNTNVELWLALGATYAGSGNWEVDTGSKAILTFTTAQVYEAYAATVADDGATTLLSGTIIPQVPAGAPVSGPIGLGLLALAVAGGGALMIRRKK